MRTCSYCGKEYSDDTAQCAVDGTNLIGEIPPRLPPYIQSASPVAAGRILTERQLRIFELILVYVVAVGGSLLASVYFLFGQPMGSTGSSLQWSHGLLSECAALALLWYVLFRRSKSLSDIGFGWRRGDIGWSILLYLGGYLLHGVVYTVIYYSGLGATSHRAAAAAVTHYLFGGGIFVPTLIFQCVNPFFEELIVRAYVMTEVRELTNSAATAIICSTILQTGYHLYQGVPLALSAGAMFLLWSLYYSKTNRVTPIILSHLYFDSGATLLYLARHY